MWKEVNSLSEAVQACEDYISEWGLGGGNWAEVDGCGKVVWGKHEEHIANISYNGRVWTPEGAEWIFEDAD